MGYKIILFFICVAIIECTPWEFPSAKYQKYVLNCDCYRNCEKLYQDGLEIFEKEGCDGKIKINFVWQLQRRQYCVDLQMYLDIAKQKMENYKK